MSNVAIVQDGYNKEEPLSTMKVVTKPIPKASAGHVVVHITARPINPVDFMALRGIYGSAVNGTAGSKGFGFVHEVGEGVTNFHKGQRVIPITAPGSTKGNGSFQEYVCLEARYVLPCPDDMPDEVAAQFVINPWAAYSMMKDLQVPKGEYIIQGAAGSVLGKMVISLAKDCGIKTINVVRRSQQKAELKALDADEVICSAEEDVVARVKEITAGEGAWGALDPVFGPMTPILAATVKDGGRLFVYGLLGGSSTTIYASDLFRGVTFAATDIYKMLINSPEKCHACAAEAAPLIRNEIIPVAPVEKYNLTDFKQAMEKAERSGGSLKILLVST